MSSNNPTQRYVGSSQQQPPVNIPPATKPPLSTLVSKRPIFIFCLQIVLAVVFLLYLLFSFSHHTSFFMKGSSDPHIPAPGKCAQMCPAVYQPVCGSNGETYSNSCQLRVASCRLTQIDSQAHIEERHDGPCKFERDGEPL